MNLTTAQEKMFQDVAALVPALGGMPTKSHAYPLTMNTKGGIMRTRPAFDGIEVLFDEPARANAQGIPCHAMKGTMKFELPLGSYNDPAAMDALVERYRTFVQPLLLK